jgi:hypothetical protein
MRSSPSRCRQYARKSVIASGRAGRRSPGTRSPFKDARIILRSCPRWAAIALIDHPFVRNACASTQFSVNDGRILTPFRQGGF